MSRTTARLVFLVTAAFFAVFFLWPILQIIKGGFIDADGRLTLGFLRAILSDPTYLTALRNSFLLACAGTTLALLIALPLAVVSDRFLFPLKGLLNSAVLVPMILPPFVGAIGIRQIFGQYGAANALIVALGLRPLTGWTFDWFAAANQFLGDRGRQGALACTIIYLIDRGSHPANIDPAMGGGGPEPQVQGPRRPRYPRTGSPPNQSNVQPWAPPGQGGNQRTLAARAGQGEIRAHGVPRIMGNEGLSRVEERSAGSNRSETTASSRAHGASVVPRAAGTARLDG